MIKLFEEYNDYYHEITYDEYIHYSNQFWLSFTKNEFIGIENKMCELIQDCDIWKYDWTGNLSKTDDAALLAFTFRMGKTLVNVEMHKLSDEWFITYHLGKFYKCDQFEGLIKCLEDILIYNS